MFGLDQLRGLFRGRWAEGWLLKLTQGAEPSSRRGRLPPLHAQYPKPSWRLLQRAGLQYRLDISDYNDWYYYFGLKDQALSWLLGQLQPGEVLVDVGANMGQLLLPAAQRLGSGGQAIGFEPYPPNLERLRHNISLNPQLSVQVESTALAAEPKALWLEPQELDNLGTVRPTGYLHSLPAPHAVAVQALPLDQWVQGQPLHRLDYLKLDAEGYELEILQGAAQTLQQLHPRLFIELDERNLAEYGAHPTDVLDLLRKLGYSQFWHMQQKRPLGATESFKGCHFDLLATVQGQRSPAETS